MADVSLIAGLYGRPSGCIITAHRQHLRMSQSGCYLSRGRPWLIMWAKGIDLLTALCQKPCSQTSLGGSHISMDETADEGGSTRPRTRRLKLHANTHNAMKQTSSGRCTASKMKWPYVGVFTAAKQHAMEQLTGFNGTLLSDGYAVYSQGLIHSNSQGPATLPQRMLGAHFVVTSKKQLDYYAKESAIRLGWNTKVVLNRSPNTPDFHLSRRTPCTIASNTASQLSRIL